MDIKYLITHSGGFHAHQILSSIVHNFIYNKTKIIPIIENK